MKTPIKFSICGFVAGAVLMFVAVLIIEWQLDKHPTLDVQVLEHLEGNGYPMDSLGDYLYSFVVEDDKFIFDYFPSDQSYLRILASYGAEEFTYDQVAAACVKVMSKKKNCIMIPIETDSGMFVRISCESFVPDDDELDTYIIDRSIRVIQQAVLQFYRCLYGSDEDEEVQQS